MLRLKELRGVMGLSQAELGDRLGVKQNTVSQWEKGIRQLDAETLVRLSELFHVTVDSLMGREDADWALPLRRAYAQADTRTRREVCRILNISPVLPGAQRGMVSMPVYLSPAAAGTPLDASTEWENMEFPAGEVPAHADFGVRVRGESMEPTIADGQIVWVHSQIEIASGEIGIFMLDDGAVCKRLRLSRSGQVLCLESDNPAYEPIRGAALAGLRAVGRVI